MKNDRNDAGGANNDHELFGSSLPLEDRKRNLCEALCAIHGMGRRALEASGEHLYIPCPVCRQNYGHARERRSKHLAINLDTYFSAARFQRTKKSGKGIAGYAMCMKHGEPFTIEQLMKYPVQPDAGGLVSIDAPAERYLVPDDKGNMIPDGPGEETPITSLAADHPAIVYLRSRGYDASLLAAQFSATFCTREAPEGKQFGNRFYRTHAGGFKSTPQGRVIFHAHVLGANNCWQGRYLEIKEKLPDGSKRTWVYHPYEKQWVIAPDWAKGEEPVKYLTANGSHRNASLGGYDHAVSRAKHSGDDWCLITEGPLDAARAPNNGLCLFGRYVSEVQAMLIRRHFRRVILGFDTDVWGRKSCIKAEEVFARHGVSTARFFPGDEPTESKQDIGELGYEATDIRIRELLATF